MFCAGTQTHKDFLPYIFRIPVFGHWDERFVPSTETPVKAAMHRMLALSINTHVARLILGQA